MNVNQITNKIGIYSKEDLGLFHRETTGEGISFANYLTDAIHKVNDLEKNASDYSTKLASGELENIHEAMIASQKSEISVLFMMEIRNKVLDAYREIMRMQI